MTKFMQKDVMHLARDVSEPKLAKPIRPSEFGPSSSPNRKMEVSAEHRQRYMAEVVMKMRSPHVK